MRRLCDARTKFRIFEHYGYLLKFMANVLWIMIFGQTILGEEREYRLQHITASQ